MGSQTRLIESKERLLVAEMHRILSSRVKPSDSSLRMERRTSFTFARAYVPFQRSSALGKKDDSMRRAVAAQHGSVPGQRQSPAVLEAVEHDCMCQLGQNSHDVFSHFDLDASPTFFQSRERIQLGFLQSTERKCVRKFFSFRRKEKQLQFFLNFGENRS